ncbi:MAG TPA: tripartite tricarboxylate transporter substrate binding protein [Eoetvoesiella sp.]
MNIFSTSLSRAALTLIGITCIAMGPLEAAAQASTYPERAITMIVPFPPGGPTDVFARVLAQRLGEELNQSVIVDNRGGAAGNIGVAAAAKTHPDGYTILFGTASIAIAPSVYKTLAYDPLTDLLPVALVGTVPPIVLVPPNGPDNIQELVKLLKENPGQYSYATSGHATATHLVTELFNKYAKVNAIHVPYRGSGPAKQGLLSNLHLYTFETASSTMSVIKSGQLKPIGIAADKRSAILPDVPTIAEAGIAGVNGSTWNMVFVPAGTAPSIVKTLNTAVNKALLDAPTAKKLATLAVDTTTDSTPASAKQYLSDEIKRWKEIVKVTGVSTN